MARIMLLLVYITSFTLLFVINPSFGDVRCFCNLSSCAQTGYMCKSEGPNAACYSEFLAPKISLKSSRHGCIEKLPNDLKERCTLTVQTSIETGSSVPSLVCCQSDMCNYLGGQHYQSQQSATLVTSNSWAEQLWFKVSLIALPIGGLVLLAMVCLVVLLLWKYLRQDTRSQRHILEHKKECGEGQFSKPDLLLSTHAYDHNVPSKQGIYNC